MDKGLEKTGLQCGVATCSEGFEKCFLRFRQAIAAQASKMTFQRTHNKTLETSCRPSLYIKCVLPEAVSFFPSSKSFKLISCVWHTNKVRVATWLVSYPCLSKVELWTYGVWQPFGIGYTVSFNSIRRAREDRLPLFETATYRLYRLYRHVPV